MRASKAIMLTLVIIFTGVLVFCGLKLVKISLSYKEANDTYKEVDEIFEEPEEDAVDPGNKDTNKTRWKWDYQKMLELCSDAVGYIRQETTPISYPILQADSNDKYLRHMYDGTYNIAGSIFVDHTIEGALKNRYAVVYGHNMDDGSMFGTITKYKDEKYYKTHPTFEVYVEDRHYVYHVFSAFQASAYGYVFRYNLTDEEFLEQEIMLRNECAYETTAPELDENSHILILSTCIDYPRDYNYRWVVCLVRGEEIIDE